MVKEALEDSPWAKCLRFIEDGEELLDYLLRRNQYSEAEKFPLPSLILLDLNMPRKDGREALKEIKSSPVLRHIPIVIFTTSSTEEDIRRSYCAGVNSFVTKPSSFDRLVDVLTTLAKYWLDIVQLPAPGDRIGICNE